MKGAAVDAGLGAAVGLSVDLTVSPSFSVAKGSVYVAFFELQKAATFRFSSLYKLKLRDIAAFLTQKCEFICYYLFIYYFNKITEDITTTTNNNVCCLSNHDITFAELCILAFFFFFF